MSLDQHCSKSWHWDWPIDGCFMSNEQ